MKIISSCIIHYNESLNLIAGYLIRRASGGGNFGVALRVQVLVQFSGRGGFVSAQTPVPVSFVGVSRRRRMDRVLLRRDETMDSLHSRPQRHGPEGVGVRNLYFINTHTRFTFCLFIKLLANTPIFFSTITSLEN